MFVAATYFFIVISKGNTSNLFEKIDTFQGIAWFQRNIQPSPC